jgi:hypothetical protein
MGDETSPIDPAIVARLAKLEALVAAQQVAFEESSGGYEPLQTWLAREPGDELFMAWDAPSRCSRRSSTTSRTGCSRTRSSGSPS